VKVANHASKNKLMHNFSNELLQVVRKPISALTDHIATTRLVTTI